jgi:hypothetical protein
MSYLNPLRLHFAGRFQASVSTVNNDPLHYDNRTFQPAYQDRQTRDAPNGWWNPGGDAYWRLIGCKVTAAYLADGSPVAKDPVLQYLIADSDRKVAAKLADLDPEQQLVSMIWGLGVRVCDGAGHTLLRGKFDPAAFMDIWDRSGGGGGDIGAGAMYQSVLTDLEWGDVSSSPFLGELKKAAATGLLSIKFNVDGYNMNFQSPEFTRGRVVGTIGPATADEPRHFTAGRQFMTTAGPGGNFFAPAGQINFCSAVVNRSAGKVYLDLGNALPTVTPGGALVNLGAIALVAQAANGPAPIDVAYTDPGWYEQTAGVVELPAGRRLTDQELDTLEANPLALLLTPAAGGQPAVAIAESPGGLYARADQFVYRLDAGEKAEVRVFATRLGRRYAGARIIAFLDPTGLQPSSQLGQAPPVATPARALEFPARVVADGHGVAILHIATGDPGNPRGFIDGQVYGVRVALEETLPPAVAYPFSPWHFVSLLVFDAFHPDDPPTWHGSLQPVFQQYANLYPVMKRFLDLGSYASVRANRKLLLLAFGLEPADPNSMPATRDLSKAKRRAILRWLAADPPPEGTAPAAAPKPMAAPAPAPAAAPAAKLPEGGKAAAASRRLAAGAVRHLQ